MKWIILMAIAFVQQATMAQLDASSTTAPSITLNGVTAGNCLVLVGSIYDVNETWTISSTSDGENTYTTRAGVQTFVGGGSRSRSVIAYAVNIATSGNKTVSVNLSGTSAGSNRYTTLGLMEFSGVATASPEDTFDANDDINTASSDISAGPITTTDAGDLLIASACMVPIADNALNFGSPASHTNRYRENAGVDHMNIDASTWLPGLIQTTYTAQWSHDNEASSEGSGVIVALKPSAGGRTTKNTRAWPLGTEIGMGHRMPCKWQPRPRWELHNGLLLPSRRLARAA